MHARVFISGFVQGVGFRHFTLKNAQGLGLTGWVKNTEDNRVEAIFQGYKEEVLEMIKLCKKGPFLAEVKDVTVEWEDTNEKFAGFGIIG